MAYAQRAGDLSVKRSSNGHSNPLADYLPRYRQSEIYERVGVDLQRSTLANWVGQCVALLRPLVEAAT